MIGPMFRKMHLARSIRMIGTMAGAGISLVDCVQTANDLCGERLLPRAVDDGAGAHPGRRQLSETMMDHPLVPRAISQMIHSGEKSGKLAFVMDQVSGFAEQELKEQIADLTRYIEPIMIIHDGVHHRRRWRWRCCCRSSPSVASSRTDIGATPRSAWRRRNCENTGGGSFFHPRCLVAPGCIGLHQDAPRSKNPPARHRWVFETMHRDQGVHASRLRAAGVGGFVFPTDEIGSHDVAWRCSRWHWGCTSDRSRRQEDDEHANCETRRPLKRHPRPRVIHLSKSFPCYGRPEARVRGGGAADGGGSSPGSSRRDARYDAGTPRRRGFGRNVADRS
jgi:hypothetical protein